VARRIGRRIVSVITKIEHEQLEAFQQPAPERQASAATPLPWLRAKRKSA
jgi:hypothetical protein